MLQVKIQQKILFNITKRELQLLIYMRQLKFGKFEVVVRDGVPQDRIKQKEKQIDISKIEVKKT